MGVWFCVECHVWFNDTLNPGSNSCPACGTEGKEEGTKGMMGAIELRGELTTRLAAALAHLRRDEALAIATSFISLNELQEIVEFQENR